MIKHATKLALISKSKMDYLREKEAGEEPEHSASDVEDIASEAVEANISKVNLGSIESGKTYEKGAPFPCAGCQAYFNVYSKDNLAKEGLDTFWICEFCKKKNKLTIKPSEYPSSNAVTYILESGKPQKKEKKIEKAAKEEKEEAKKPVADNSSVIFCIDNSGSMNESTKTTTSIKIKYMSSKKKISRLEAVKLAIDAQINKMVKEAPNAKVGFVTFETEVCLLGDGSASSITLDKKIYGSFDKIVESVEEQSSVLMTKNIKASSSLLLGKLEELLPKNCTALGPGLVAAVTLAKNEPRGSKVIICTDGIANEGIGKIENAGSDLEEGKAFYNKVGLYAKEHGVVVSVISLVSTECKLDLLSPIAELTGGDILRVDPMNLSKDFSSLIAEKIIANSVVVKVKLHKVMEFADIPEEYLSADKSTYIQEIGSISKETNFTYKYTMRHVTELEEMKDIVFKTFDKFPEQAQIEYIGLDGKKYLKVITQIIECSESEEEANEEVDYGVTRSCCGHTMARYAKHGRYDEAIKKQKKIAKLAAKEEDAKKLEEEMKPMANAITKQAKEQKESGDIKHDDLAAKINQAMKKS